MFNVCPNCGQYRADKLVEAGSGEWATAICPDCRTAVEFRRGPLLLLTGASGSGKTAITLQLAGLIDCIVLEGDLLWQGQEADTFVTTWLRLAKNISQSGHRCLLVGAGFNPPNVEQSVERRYFGRVEYLALVCDSDIQRRRLQARPAWRGFQGNAGASALEEQLAYNRWFWQQSELSLLDTSKLSIAESVAHVADWCRERLTALGHY